MIVAFAPLILLGLIFAPWKLSAAAVMFAITAGLWRLSRP
jgi:hypothetical protein